MNRAGETVEAHALRRAFVFNRRLLTRKVNGGMRKIAHYAMIMQRFSPNSNQPTAVSRFMAMWYVTNQKNGVSALGLQRVLGLGSYETAWTWLHKLRRAMVRPGRDSLRGTVEVDETYVGGVEKGKRGRETETKAIVAVAAEENGKGIGRIRLRRVKDVSGASLLPFVQAAAVKGAVIHTDGWSGYSGLTAAGYKHEVTVCLLYT